MKITEFERHLKSIHDKALTGTISIPLVRLQLRELDLIRNNAETPNKRFVMTLFLQTYREKIMKALRDNSPMKAKEVEPITIISRI